MFDALHINNSGIPLCGNGGFDRDLLVNEDTFLTNPDNDTRCWECGSIIGIDTTQGAEL
jgi:hypothetical protein